MKYRWKSGLFVMLAVSALFFAMTGYDVKADTTEKIDISGEDFSISFKENEEYTYTGSAITPDVTVTAPAEKSAEEEAVPQTEDDTKETVTWVKDTDYTVTYENNTNAGTATAIVAPKDTTKYTGEVKLTFTINPKDIGDLQMEGKDKVYKGRELNADVNMYYNNMKLERSKDYRIKDYVNNLNVGVASATVKGKGNYTGERTMTFEITAKNIYELSYSPDLSQKSYQYNGQYQTPSVSFVFDILGEDNKITGQKTLTEGVDYTITYADNKKVGVAGVMIIGKGNFTGSRIMSFKIRPQNTKLKKLVKGKKQLKAKWAAKDKQVTGYVVMCSTKKDFSSNVKKAVS